MTWPSLEAAYQSKGFFKTNDSHCGLFGKKQARPRRTPSGNLQILLREKEVGGGCLVWEAPDLSRMEESKRYVQSCNAPYMPHSWVTDAINNAYHDHFNKGRRSILLHLQCNGGVEQTRGRAHACHEVNVTLAYIRFEASFRSC